MRRNEELLKYVEKVYHIERQKHGILNAIRIIDGHISNANQRIYSMKNDKGKKYGAKENTISISEGLFACLIIAIVPMYVFGVIGFALDLLGQDGLGMLLGIIAVPFSVFWPLFGPLEWGKEWFSSLNFKWALMGYGIGIILCIIFIVVKNLKTGKANKQIDRENKQIAWNNKNEKMKNESEIRRLESWIAKDLQPEKQKLLTLLKQTEKLRKDYYAKNIIGEKYRDLIPVSFFYEYLSYGRCDTLTGHEGAYNIFENFILLNDIRLKVDTIIQQLEEIKCDQRMLFSAIKENEKQNAALIGGLKNQLNSISNNQRECIEAIQYNTRCAEEQRSYTNFLLTMDRIKRY